MPFMSVNSKSVQAWATSILYENISTLRWQQSWIALQLSTGSHNFICNYLQNNSQSLKEQQQYFIKDSSSYGMRPRLSACCPSWKLSNVWWQCSCSRMENPKTLMKLSKVLFTPITSTVDQTFVTNCTLGNPS